DKRRLMSAIAAAGFDRLCDRLRGAGPPGTSPPGTSPPDTRTLTELGSAYLAFALENPGLYSLMFGPSAEVDPADEALARAGGEAFALLAQESAAEQAPAADDPGPIAAWALVHGLAM